MTGELLAVHGVLTSHLNPCACIPTLRCRPLPRRTDAEAGPPSDGSDDDFDPRTGGRRRAATAALKGRKHPVAKVKGNWTQTDDSLLIR